MILNNQPIGVFDSGLGGLSVWKEIISQSSGESVIYLADSANCPYGPKPDEEILSLAKKSTEFLLEKGCKIIVVACNTATAAAIEHLRKTYSVPFVGMEPAVKPAALNSKTGHIGILATQGTFNGKLFKETSHKFGQNVEIHVQVGHGLVELVEKGQTSTPEAFNLLQQYIQPMLQNQIDHLVLGCTHYPFLYETIEKITKGRVIILDPSPAVARRICDILKMENLEVQSGINIKYNFYTNGSTRLMKDFIAKFFEIDAKIERW